MIKQDDKIYQLSSALAWQIEQTKGYIYVLDGRKNLYYSFTGIGKDIWLYISNGLTLDCIIDRLVDTYNASREIIQDDVCSFINELEEQQLIT